MCFPPPRGQKSTQFKRVKIDQAGFSNPWFHFLLSIMEWFLKTELALNGVFMGNVHMFLVVFGFLKTRSF
ncbi:hypothetical protein HPCU_05815 [Helicobacter pylori Cuz20]|uniref:Uncharacterized protein n=1 Tax=Helicobacter pylori (strain Cuz20) TaxID=765964 RepID=A0AB32X913_HELPC|nr:hypothetical protein HPCU_05815 [Helicobacter pylori Cuz20]AFI01328.1 hypothetical protein HPSH112_05685 [Helicobacter pylori Shi112]